MANIVSNLNIKPYYDTTEAELEKGYSQFLAVEDRVLQNRELNVMQGLLQGNLRKITDLIIDNASIASGCSFIKRNDTKQCVLTAGEVYFNGLIIHVDEHIWDFSEVPDKLSFVYLEVFKSTIDEIEDPSLYDPAEVYENHGQPGGHRLKYITIPHILNEKDFKDLSLTKTNIVPLMKIYEKETYGPLKPTPVFGKLYNMLAQRTYDSLGDFLAEGLRVTAVKSDNNSKSFYNILISPGKAYIKGFEYKYDKQVSILFKSAVDTKSCGLEHSLGSDINTYVSGTLKYRLSRNFVKTIDHLNALVENNGIMLNYDPISNVNNLPTNITSINSIDEIYDYSGAGGTKKTYAFSEDYIIESSNTSIVWKTSGEHPTGTFYVDITVSKEIDKEHYQLFEENNISYIMFKNDGLKPKNNTNFNTSYTWILSRIDLVYLTQEGFIRVKAGIPNDIGSITKPSIPTGALPLAYITVIPKQRPENFDIDSFDIYRVPIIQLQSMKRKINDFEYNFAMSELEKLAQNKHIEKENITTLRNIFADSIVSYDKVDLGNPEFDATVDLFKSEVTLPFNIDHVTSHDVVVLDEDGNEVKETFGPTTLNILENAIVDSQPKATHHKDIAPFVFKSMNPSVEVTPKVLSHIEENNISRIIWLPNRLVYKSTLVEKWKTVNRTVSATGSSRYSYNTTSNTVQDVYKTQSSIIGEEYVETKMVEISTVPQPFIFEPSYIMVTGKRFLPNTEIRIELDNTHVLDAEYVDTTFENAEYNYFGEKINVIDTLQTPSSDNPLISPDWQDINENFPRPTTWKIYKKYTDQNVYASGNEERKNNGIFYITHPSYDSNSVIYKYDNSNKEWYYRYSDQTEADFIQLDLVPLFLKWVTRTPWFNTSVDSIINEDLKMAVMNLNIFEPVTMVKYTHDYADTKTPVISDQYGNFKALVKLPNNTEMSKHDITCYPVVYNDFDIDEYHSATDDFTAESYIRNWDQQVYHRKIEQIETILYRTYVTTNTRVNVCHSDCFTRSPERREDPLAQSFEFEENLYLTAIDLYFIAKSPDFRSVVFFDIRENSSDGFPTGKIIYSKDINREDIIVGDNYPATNIKFDYPVFIEANKSYSFVIGASINGYKILYAKMGHNDLITGEPVLYNAVISGVMYESSNNEVWSPIQDSDLKYTLYRSVFDLTPRTFYINNINKNNKNTAQNFGVSNTNIPHVTFEKTDVIFEHKVAHSLDFNDSNWQPLNLEEKYEYLPSPENIINMKHSIKITLTSESDFISPIVQFSGFESFYGKYKNFGSYIQIPLTLD